MSFLQVILIIQAIFWGFYCQAEEQQPIMATATTLLAQSKFDHLTPPIRLDECPLNDDFAHPVFLPYPYDCGKYYSCLRGYAYLLSCPLGLFWSTLTYRCDYPAMAKCQPQPQPQPVPPPPYPNDKFYYLPYEADCSKYFQCQLLQCEPQTMWNARVQRCDYASYPYCNNQQPPAPTPVTPPMPITPATAATPPPPTYAPGPGQNFTETPPYDLSPYEINELCVRANGREFIAYPGDCSRFIQCNGVGFVQKCPANLYWNSRQLACDYFCVP